MGAPHRSPPFNCQYATEMAKSSGHNVPRPPLAGCDPPTRAQEQLKVNQPGSQESSFAYSQRHNHHIIGMHHY